MEMAGPMFTPKSQNITNMGTRRQTPKRAAKRVEAKRGNRGLQGEGTSRTQDWWRKRWRQNTELLRRDGPLLREERKEILYNKYGSNQSNSINR